MLALSFKVVLMCAFLPSAAFFRLDDGSMRMYYTGQGEGGTTAIGVAKFDASTKAWTREQAEFSLAA
jgi:hypothetical protein